MCGLKYLDFEMIKKIIFEFVCYVAVGYRSYDCLLGFSVMRAVEKGLLSVLK